MNGVVQTMRDEATALGFYPKRISTGGPGRPAKRWACKCSVCSSEATFGWSSYIPPDMMAKNAQQAGWGYRHKKLVCPTCISAEKDERMSNKIDTVANPKLQRKVFNLLDEHFNEETRLYDAGWSDKKVAEAAQTSEQYVISLRKGAYADLAEDPAITALRGEVADLENKSKTLTDALMTTVDEIEKKIAALNTRLDTYAMKKAS